MTDRATYKFPIFLLVLALIDLALGWVFISIVLSLCAIGIALANYAWNKK